ncbi:AAA family ATPase [Nocardia sp. NPDC004568]|uniref:ATP-binding protein n=1 Tax=Nocardia sp. NPDC004568 TaxID=3154551 RepID=UPI0033B10AC7
MEVLHGRKKEQALLADLVNRAMAGVGGAAVVHGDPGIGKSALIDEVVRRIPAAQVFRVTCVEPEAELGYATLRRLIAPALDSIDRLPPPQAEALRAVSGTAASHPPNQFLVGLATLSLLSELAGEQPLVCLVDDAQWADRPSARVLDFVARRLETEPIALVLAARTTERLNIVSGVLDIPLTGLDRQSARALLLERTGDGLSAAQQETALTAAVGNPLALRELPLTALCADVLPDPLPLAAELQDAFAHRARDLGEPVQMLLLLVAVDGHTRSDVLRRALESLAVRWPAGGIDEAGDLLMVDSTSAVAFRHPLMRSAVYHGADPAHRSRAHRAMATALDGDPGTADRRAWHLGQAAEGEDEAVAGELERAAHRAARVSTATGAALLARAAELSAAGPRRAQRRFESAAAWWASGDFDRAASMLASIENDRHAGESLRWNIVWLRASLELHTGAPAAALPMLRPILSRAAETNGRQALPLLVLFNEASFCANANAWSEVAEAAERLNPVGDGIEDVLGRLFRGSCRVRAGREPGLAPGDLDVVEQLTEPAWLWWASGFMLGLGHKDRARRLSRLTLHHARRLGAVVLLPWALWRMAGNDIEAGRFRSAAAYTEEGLRIAEETGQLNAGLALRGSLALLAALRGEEELAVRLAREVVADGTARGMIAPVVTAGRALGMIELAAGRPDLALAHLASPGGSYLGLAMVKVPDLVEAAAQADRPELAAEPLTSFNRWAGTAGKPELNALAARCRALLATGNSASGEFRRALALHAQADQPLEQARTQLLYGRHLRRERRPSQAREPLRTALEAFETLGARIWAECAREELRAAGETRKGPITDGIAALTAQEAGIAEAVADGLTNREIAGQLFLSTRTVDYHLRKIFAKTRVSSRAELTRIVLGEGRALRETD